MICITGDTHGDFDRFYYNKRMERQGIRLGENDYVIVDGSDGEQALVNRTELPQIRGVVILCDGGEDASISRRVTEAASVLLGVSTNRICVNQLS